MANLLIFYDWEQSFDHEKWLVQALNFFNNVGAQPNCGDYLGNDDVVKKIRPDQMGSVLAELRPDQAGLSTLLPPFRDVNLYSNLCMYRDVPGERAKLAFFCFESNSLELDLLLAISEPFVTAIKPAYGFAVLWPFLLSPPTFAFNGSTGSKIDGEQVCDVEDIKRIRIWRNERMESTFSPENRAPFRHLHGMLRDVFEFNVLSQRHLESDVSGVKLFNWITAGERRGQISEIGRGYWTWIVPSQDLSSVQAEMQNAGLLITRARER